MSNIKLDKIFKTVCIASDHAGYNMKEFIKNNLVDKRNYKVGSKRFRKYFWGRSA